VAPETAYGRSKANAEAFLLSTLDRVTILRTAILHGYSHPRRRNTVEFIESRLRAGEPIELYEDVFACPTFIGDLAACVRRVLAERLVGVHHACGPEYVSRCDIAAWLCAARGYDPRLIHAIPRPDTSNIPRYLHLRPSPALQDLLTSRLGATLLRKEAHIGAAAPAQTALP
jgi:dTDP-4-dehydrorhamnose reductase